MWVELTMSPTYWSEGGTPAPHNLVLGGFIKWEVKVNDEMKTIYIPYYIEI